MANIGSSVTKKDHKEKTDGSAKYIADMHFDNLLHAAILRSTKACAKIMSIRIPELEEGYYIVDGKDAKGVNGLQVIQCDQPLFASDRVNYIGEAILMIVGPDLKKVQRITSQIGVTYEEETPILSLKEATESFTQYSHEKGYLKEGFERAAFVFEEEFETGYQEQAYIEPQGVVGIYENNKITVYGSMQCPYYVKKAVEVATGLPPENVQIIQATTGGGFGGKEDFPSMISCQVAVAAMKVNQPVRLILNRREDLAVTPKRHPGIMKYRTAVDQEGNILAIDVDISLNAGAYDGLSSVVLQRSVIAAIGVYKTPGLRVIGRVLKTNTVPNGAFRGFGAPQVFFCIEMHMKHLAEKLGRDPIEFKASNWVTTGDPTSTEGCFVHEILLEDLVQETAKRSDFKKKYENYQSQTGRYRKGIGMSLFYHGCGYTGSGERDFVKAVVRLAKHEDNRVEILAANVDMGQGLKTTFSKIVANTLDIPYENVFYENPDTDRVPNSGPTVASRTLMIVGRLLERAAIRLKKEWKSGEYQMIEEHYVHPDMIPWELETFSGDAYPAYSWGVNVVEVEFDRLLGTTKLKGIWGGFDIGTPIDETIAKGQMEGGMLQGLGYGSSEKMQSGTDGRILQASLTDYIIPTAMDTIPFETFCIDNPYAEGPYGAKGMGELTLMGTAPAYALAVEQAVGKPIQAIPVTPENMMELCC